MRLRCGDVYAREHVRGRSSYRGVRFSFLCPHCFYADMFIVYSGERSGKVTMFGYQPPDP